MRKKIIGIFVCVLLITVSVFPVAGYIDQVVDNNNKPLCFNLNVSQMHSQY